MLDLQYNLPALLAEADGSDMFLHVIPRDGRCHPTLDVPCVLFIKNIRSGKNYYCSFDHPDIKNASDAKIYEIIRTINNLNSTKWVLDKKVFLHLIPFQNLYDLNFSFHSKEDKLIELEDFKTVAQSVIQKNVPPNRDLNKIIPFVKHQEFFSDLSESCANIIRSCYPLDPALILFNEHMFNPLCEIEKNGLEIDIDLFKKYFDQSVENSRVYTQYNFYTNTGRPSNRFGGINYSAINKENGARQAFISRFGKDGKLFLLDYSAFHPRIISYLTGTTLSPDLNVYEHFAKLFFNKKEVDGQDVSDAKQITFRQLFGGVQDEYKHIIFFSHLSDFINKNWEQFLAEGYVETPIFKRKIFKNHILNATPPKVFNYILQALEGEIALPLISSVNEYLKNRLTKVVLYTYDSILIDYCSEDGNIIKNVSDILTMNFTFPIKVYSGNNYQAMSTHIY